MTYRSSVSAFTRASTGVHIRSSGAFVGLPAKLQADTRLVKFACPRTRSAFVAPGGKRSTRELNVSATQTLPLVSTDTPRADT